VFSGIVFDFDGVILESAGIKTRAFERLFAAWPEAVPAIRAYHLAHAGISRHVKIAHICAHLLGLPDDPAREAALAERFGDLVWDEVLAAPLVPGVEAVLAAPLAPYAIASGTPHDELQRILAVRGLTGAFWAACGSPTPKPVILRDLLARRGWRAVDVVFVGDGESDRDAAADVGMPFVARVHHDGTLPREGWWIHDLTELPARLRDIEAARS